MRISFNLLRIKGLYVSSITCSSSEDAAQTSCGILRAYNVSWLWRGCSESATVPLNLNKLNEKCITLVSFYWYTMMYGQENLKLGYYIPNHIIIVTISTCVHSNSLVIYQRSISCQHTESLHSRVTLFSIFIINYLRKGCIQFNKTYRRTEFQDPTLKGSGITHLTQSTVITFITLMWGDRVWCSLNVLPKIG
jgi:hypothetical protein